ncbi:hypothetical protein [Paenibacillus sp. Z6-24]
MKSIENTDYAKDDHSLRNTIQCYFYIESLSLVWAADSGIESDPTESLTITEEFEDEQQQVEEELEYLNSWERMLEFI